MQKETYGIFIHQIHNTIEKSVNNQFRKKGLTLSRMNVLIELVSVLEKKISFKELEKRLTLAQSTMAGLISRLVQKELVAVLGDRDDKRIKYVEITVPGIKFGSVYTFVTLLFHLIPEPTKPCKYWIFQSLM